LRNVENELIKRIKEWVIEAHSKEIASDLIRKFNSCGFKLKKILPFRIESTIFVVILYFKKS